MRVVRECKTAEVFQRDLLGVRCGKAVNVLERERDVCERAEVREEIERLEDDAEMAAVLAEFFLAKINRLAVELLEPVT